LNLGAIAQEETSHLKALIKKQFTPKSPQLSESNYPVVDESAWRAMPVDTRKSALVIYAPATSEKTIPQGFKKSSYYVIARGLAGTTNETVKEDIDQLKKILADSGFFGYSGNDYGFGSEYASDMIFEKDDAFGPIVKASRENFRVRGSQSHAILEMSDYEQRLITLNHIEDQIHEDLLRERDGYHAAQINPQLDARLDVPAPTRNIYWSNLQLSTKKFFRGDDRKVLKWGLDLSGGKSVRIGLKDKSGRLINNKDDLEEGVNQLYKRVNKMGLSEVSIRVEGSNILLDFPGSQGLSSSELIKAASMTFHIVNEKFSPLNRSLGSYVNEFLQEVWNEVVVTNNKEPEQIQMLAWKHLGGRPDSLEFFPESEAAKILYENGLRLAGPNSPLPSSNFNDTLSGIAVLRGEDFASWEGQTHPLLVVFHNFALEGSSLEKVQGAYDPQKGNMLTFSVIDSGQDSAGQKRHFRDDLFAWTNQFSQEKIMGTPKQAFSSGRGWRMAVVLNGTIISSPALNSPIRDHAMITGHFTQREINQLVADLKAGSLSFTPKILSENNISPDLGTSERFHGITAAALATVFVIIAMIIYYRFAGIVASVAVLFNLAIMWAVLQNLEAALTLPSIAGIILTIGMAVDANVLVYERVREELESGKRLPSALAAGYSKAFSAIMDSNLTTIIAALILLQFDSGPIKGFALTLIIGII
ncbi:MAG: protein translocase subunit SecD, partial [Chlamydiota bacterium]